MKYIEENGNILLKDYDSFIISQTLECGQCFNFSKIDEEDYIVLAHKKALHIYQKGADIVFEDTSKEEFENIWADYFDLNRDYEKIKKFLSEKDETLKAAVEYAPGIRIINQEFFPCLISFIISQNNRIPMIKKVVYNISKEYGDYIRTVGDEEFYSFPEPERLLGKTHEDFKECKAGFRGKYIVDAVNKFICGEVGGENFEEMPTKLLRETLMQINGVGPKVADCVMLFSLKKSDAFPTDVWVKRVMSHFYFGGQETPIKKIHEFADEKFGEYSGFAQQYLFNYARQFKIGA